MSSTLKTQHSTRKTRSGLPRLLVGALLSLFSTLTVVQARAWSAFVLALLATEAGHLFAPAAFSLLWPERRRSLAGLAGAALGATAGALLLSPTLRAQAVAQRLPAELAAAFGTMPPRSRPGAPPRPTPLDPATLLWVQLPPVRRDTYAYSLRHNRALHLDLYRPLGAASSLPCVVYVHGGSWQSGTRGDFPQLMRYLAARGYAVASVEYRLMPEARFPGPQEDIAAAIAYLQQNASELGIDPQRFVTAGRSAGGQVALLAAYSGNPAIRGTIGLYAPTDMHYGYANPARPRVIDSRAIMRRFCGGTPAEAAATYTAASPIAQATANAPPTLLIHGTRDEVVSVVQSRRMADRLAALGVPHMLLELPWATHGMEVLLFGPGGQLSIYAIERFLAAVSATR